MLVVGAVMVASDPVMMTSLLDTDRTALPGGSADQWGEVGQHTINLFKLNIGPLFK